MRAFKIKLLSDYSDGLSTSQVIGHFSSLRMWFRASL